MKTIFYVWYVTALNIMWILAILFYTLNQQPYATWEGMSIRAVVLIIQIWAVLKLRHHAAPGRRKYRWFTWAVVFGTAIELAAYYHAVKSPTTQMIDLPHAGVFAALCLVLIGGAWQLNKIGGKRFTDEKSYQKPRPKGHSHAHH